MGRRYRWVWIGLILFAFWFLLLRDTPMPRGWGHWGAAGATPEAAALAFMPPDGEGGERRTTYAVGSFAWVKIHRSMKGDDSVRSVTYTVRVRRMDGTWRVRSATYSQSCLRSLWVPGRSCL